MGILWWASTWPKQLGNDLKAWKRKVEQRAGRNYQVLADALTWGRSIRQEIAVRVEAKTAEWRWLYAIWYPTAMAPVAATAPTALYYPAILASILTLGAWLMILLEGLFSGLMTVLVTDVPIWVAAVVGFSMAVLLAYGFKAVFMMIVARYQTEPKVARDTILKLLLVFGVIEVLTLSLALLIRGTSAESWIGYIAWAFGPSLGVLSVVTPIISGLCFGCAQLYSWSGDLSRELEDLTRLDHEVAAFISTCEGQRESGGVLHGAERERPQPSSTSAVVGIAMLLASLFCSVSAAGAQYIFVDHSESSRNGLSAGVQAIADNVLVLSERGIKRWHIIPFKGDAWSAEASRIVTMPTLVQTPCVPSGAAAKVFIGARKLQQAECHQRDASAAQMYEAAVKKALDEIREALTPPPASKEPHCSSITAVLWRISMLDQGSIALLLTDAAETCRPKMAHIHAPAKGVEALVVLVPPKAKGIVDEVEVFNKQRQNVLSAAPWVYAVVPPWGLRRAICDRPKLVTVSTPGSSARCHAQ